MPRRTWGRSISVGPPFVHEVLQLCITVLHLCPMECTQLDWNTFCAVRVLIRHCTTLRPSGTFAECRLPTPIPSYSSSSVHQWRRVVGGGSVAAGSLPRPASAGPRAICRVSQRVRRRQKPPPTVHRSPPLVYPPVYTPGLRAPAARSVARPDFTGPLSRGCFTSRTQPPKVLLRRHQWRRPGNGEPGATLKAACGLAKAVPPNG